MSTWHGITFDEALNIWNDVSRDVVTISLVQIASDAKATAEQRIVALQLLHEGMQLNILNEDSNYGKFTFATLATIGAGLTSSTGWWARRHQARIAERLNGLKIALQTASIFSPRLSEKTPRFVASKTPNDDVLLS